MCSHEKDENGEGLKASKPPPPPSAKQKKSRELNREERGSNRAAAWKTCPDISPTTWCSYSKGRNLPGIYFDITKAPRSRILVLHEIL